MTITLCRYLMCVSKNLQIHMYIDRSDRKSNRVKHPVSLNYTCNTGPQMRSVLPDPPSFKTPFSPKKFPIRSYGRRTRGGDLARHLRNSCFGLSTCPLLQHVLNECLTGPVGAPDQRPTGAVQESHVQGTLPPQVKYGRSHVFVHFHVAFCGLHVLPECYDVDVYFA